MARAWRRSARLFSLLLLATFAALLGGRLLHRLLNDEQGEVCVLCDDHLVVLGLETQRLDLVLRRTRERESGRARVSGQGVERVPPGALLAHVGRLEQLAHKFAGLGAQLEHNRGVVDGPLVFHVLVLDHDTCARRDEGVGDSVERSTSAAYAPSEPRGSGRRRTRRRCS